MLDLSRATKRLKITTFALILGALGAPTFAAETCVWTRTPSGADFGTCNAAIGKSYCITCQYAPRVCVRTPC